MLSDEVIEKVIERLVNRIEQTNTFVLKEIARSINKIGTMNPTKARQLVQIIKYGGDYDKIVKELAKMTKLNVKDIQDIFEEVAKSDYNFAKQFYNYRKKQFIPYKYNTQLQDEINALANITKQEYINLTQTTALGFGMQTKDGTPIFKSIKQAYSDLLDEAVLSVAQGKETFNSAMFRQLKDLSGSGLKVIYPTTYIGKDGKEHHYTRRLDSAVRMNMKSALRNLHNETQKKIAEDIDADGIEISVHENPAPDHQRAQGRQFSNDEYKKLQAEGSAKTYDGIEIDMHRGKHFRPISEWNCYHYTFAIVLGVDKPQYSNEELQKIIDRNNKGFDYEGKHYTMYEGTQLQRRIETEIRRQKDMQIAGKEAGNEQLIQESQRNISVLNKKYKELNDISGLRPKIDRLKVEGYKRVPKSELGPTEIYNIDSSKVKMPIKDMISKVRQITTNKFQERTADVKIKRDNINYSYYSQSENRIHVGYKSDEYSLIHELGHRLYYNFTPEELEEYNRIINNKFMRYTKADFELKILPTNDILAKALRKNTYWQLKNASEFVKPYQSRIYRHIKSFVNGKPNIKYANEYISVGVEYYFKEPSLLKEKDKDLYNFLDEVLKDD